MLSRALGAVVVLSAFGACSCEEAPLIHQEIDDVGVLPFPDAAEAPDAGFFPDAEPTDLGPPDTGVPEGRVLRFIGSSPVALYFGASTSLRFSLTTLSGAVVSGQTIQLSLAGAGSLAQTALTTDQNGEVTASYTAPTQAAQATIKAEAALATPVTVSLVTSEDPVATLSVDVSGTTRLPLAGTSLAVYWAAAGSAPTCAALLSAATLPAGAQTATLGTLPASQLFSPVPSGFEVSAIAFGLDARGDRIARGCAQGARVSGGVTTHLPVVIEQLPSHLDGDYDVRMELDLGATIPPPVGPIIVTLTDVLSDPAGWAVYQTLSFLDDQLGTHFVVWTPPGQTVARTATFQEVRSNPTRFVTWRNAAAALDNALETQLGQSYTDFVNIGGDVAHLIRRFEVGARFTVTSTGVPGRARVEESWRALVFEWSQGCPAGDVGCARRPIELSGANARLAPLTATYGSSVSWAPLAPESERFQLALDPHAINVRYGAILLVVLNELVFPSLPANIAGHSIGEVLANVIGCIDVANSISSSTGLPAGLIQGFCDSAVAAAGTYLEDQLLGLDSVNNPGLIDGAGGGKMFLVDADHDLETELLTDLESYVAWSDGSAPPSTPILGRGRRASSGCLSDAACTGGKVCAPVPSYLEVRGLERDCRRKVGSNVGPMACTANTDCATGLCATPAGVCFSACDPATPTCSGGRCDPVGAQVSLDPVRMGLGAAEIAACVP